MAEDSVLIVEDEENLLEALKYSFQKEGYIVHTAQDGAVGLETARSVRPSVVLLDVMLPKLNGFEVCRILRKESNVPILMLTAKGEEVDKVVGLELGADDYVTKPFSMRELLARVRSILRRSSIVAEARTAMAREGEVLSAGNLEVDLGSHIVRVAGEMVDLKPKEFDLLTLLISNKGRVLSRDQILDKVWGHDYVGDTRTVDVHVRWIREKIESEPSNPLKIVTVRGVGYRFEG